MSFRCSSFSFFQNAESIAVQLCTRQRTRRQPSTHSKKGKAIPWNSCRARLQASQNVSSTRSVGCPGSIHAGRNLAQWLLRYLLGVNRGSSGCRQSRIVSHDACASSKDPELASRYRGCFLQDCACFRLSLPGLLGRRLIGRHLCPRRKDEDLD